MPIWLHYVTNSMHSSLNKIGVKTRFFVNQDVLVVPDYFIQDVHQIGSVFSEEKFGRRENGMINITAGP